jgi:hypothetical protein
MTAVQFRTQSSALAEWLRRLVADHDGTALIVAKTVGSLIVEDGRDGWFKLSRICGLTGQSPAVVDGILHRLQHRGRLDFERRDGSQSGRRNGYRNGHDGADPEYRFTIPTEMPEQIERARVWGTITEVRKH